jgi:hypothetical protein
MRTGSILNSLPKRLNVPVGFLVKYNFDTGKMILRCDVVEDGEEESINNSANFLLHRGNPQSIIILPSLVEFFHTDSLKKNSISLLILVLDCQQYFEK